MGFYANSGAKLRQEHNSTQSTMEKQKATSADWFMVGLSVSFLLHVIGFIYLEHTESQKKTNSVSYNQPIKVNFVNKKEMKSIVEVKQEKTEATTENARHGLVDHKTDKETKISRDKLSHKKGAKATGAKKKNAIAFTKNKLRENLKSMQRLMEQNSKAQLLPLPKSKNGIKVKEAEKNPYLDKARNQYEKLLAATYESLADQTEAGYQDYIDEEIEEGDKIDLNTKEYRYIGYFSNLRRSIELVWHYPREAAMRGLEGTVGLQFSVDKKGHSTRVKVVKSSGYKELDQAIVNAVKLASPFAPLPDSFGKEKLTVTGSFSYVLSSWGVAH